MKAAKPLLNSVTKFFLISCLIVSSLLSPIANSVSATSNTPITSGWNLVGNGSANSVNVASTFSGLPVTSIWKWNADTSTWSFYTPIQADGGAAYALTKGYQKLVSINPGDGFWINASQSFTLPVFTGDTYYASNYQQGAAGQMLKGWNLVAVGEAMTPNQFNAGLSSTTPVAGVISQNLTTLWAWDSIKSNWYFYAPSLEAQGTSLLTNYIASKGYLDFAASGKLLGQGVGFWVNNPNTPTATTSSTVKTTTSTTGAVATSTTTVLRTSTTLALATTSTTSRSTTTTTAFAATTSSTATSTTTTSSSTLISTTTTTTLQVVPTAPTLSILGSAEGTNAVGNVYKVAMSDGSLAPAVQWSIASAQGNVASLTSNADGSATVRITASDLNQAYTVSVSATYGAASVSKQIVFNPQFKYSVPSYPLELTHQYEVYYDAYAFGKRLSLAWSTNTSNLVFNAFDANGWLSQKITVPIPNLASYQDYGDSSYDTVQKKLYVVRRHLTEDKLLFVVIDEATLSVNYKTLSFPVDGLTKSAWSNVYFGPDYFFTARSSLTSTNGRSSQYKRTELQILKVNYDGSATVAQTIKTSDIAGFGYSETSSGSTYSPYIKIERHFNDLLISNIASGGFTTYTGAPVQYVSQLWVPIDPATLTVKAPIWIKADKFKRAAYSEQPSLSNLSTQYWNVNVTDSGTGGVAWHPWGSFVVSSLYSSTAVSEGWLEALLTQDYSSISLNSYGVKLLDTTSNMDFVYSADRNGFLTSTKTNTNQIVNRYVGDASQLIKLPDLSTATNCSNGYGVGEMGVYQQSSSNCAHTESYYRKTTNAVQPHLVNAATKVSWATPPTVGGDSFGMDKGTLTLQRKSDDKYIYLDLNTADDHPGCTNPIPQNAVSTPVAKTIETASVQKTALPSIQNFSVTVASAQATATVAPAYLRAPILCSDSKISLDQEFVIRYRATAATSSSVTPVTYSVYTLSLTRAPLHGTYDATLNRYTPEVGFIGEDSFQLTYSDGTGTQAVEIKVKTFQPS